MSTRAWVFLGYFLVVFAIGWYSLRATRSEADYWIAGGELGWFSGGATLAATHTSAGTFVGTIGVMYTAGWSFGWVLLSIPLAYWFMAAVLAPRFTRQKELTLPAFMETRYYGKGIRGLAGLIVLVATVVYVQAQIVAGGLIANIVFGVPVTTGMMVFTAVLLVYTVAGGMIAVVYTDAFQLVVMALGALFAVPLALRQVDGLGGLLALVESAHPLVFTWETMPASLLLTMGLSFFLGGIATPEKLIRLYAMKDMATIRRGVLFAIVMILALNLLVFVLALAAIVLFPQLATGDLAMPMVATAVLPATLGAVMLAAALTTEVTALPAPWQLTIDQLPADDAVATGVAGGRGMTETLDRVVQPATEAELAEAVRVSTGPLRVLGGGTRRVGNPTHGQAVSTAGLRGVELYEPGSLTLVVRAGTPLAEVEPLLAAERQRRPSPLVPTTVV
ncbi:MAG: FAD-binding protein [Gemmatimonadetes bacterium]|nr:FAD-binding protein [Gemmatimonadota bacterium]